MLQASFRSISRPRRALRIAMGLALAVQAGYFLAQNTAVVGPAFRRWTMVVGVGLLFAPLAWLRASAPVNVVLYCGAAGAYLLVL